MSSPSPHNSLKILAVLGLAGLALILVLNPRGLETDQQNLASAQKLLENWSLIEAEQVLQPLFASPHSNTGIDRLYGEVLLARGELRRAEEIFSSLLVKDPAPRASILCNLARAHFYLGNLDSALQFARAAYAGSLSAHDTVRLAESLHLLGRVEFNKAQYDSALHHQRISVRLSHLIGDLRGEADALRQIGVLYWYRGKSDSAWQAYYEPALILYRKTGDKAGEATTLSNMGLIRANQNDWEINLRYQLTAFDIRKKIGDQVGLADSYYFFMYLPYAGKETKSFKYANLRKSFELSSRIGYAWGAEVAARAMRNFLQFDAKVTDSYLEADSSLANSSAEGRIFFLEQRAWGYASAHEPVKAIELYRKALRLCDSLRYVPERGSVLMYLSFALVETGQLDEAERCLRGAMEAAPGQEWKQPLLERALAHLYSKRGDWKRARTILTRLTSSFDSLYVSRIRQRNPGIAFEEAVNAVHLDRMLAYKDLVDLLAANNPGELFSVLERERSLPFWGENRGFDASSQDGPVQKSFKELTDLLERYEDQGSVTDVRSVLETLGELRQSMSVQQDMIAQSLSNVRRNSPPALAEIRKSLKDGEVLLEYFVGDKNVILVAVRRDVSRSYVLNIPEPDLLSLVDVYRRLLLMGRGQGRDDLWKGPSHQLYAKLLMGVVQDGMMREGDHVIISPHGVLNLIPFHALTMTEKHSTPVFCLERFYISYAPSASFLVQRRAEPVGELRSLLAVAPAGNELPFTLQEVDRIPNDAFSYISVMKNSGATADQVLRAMRHYDVLHLSAHAKMNLRFPLSSYIQCSDRKLELYEILREHLRGRLVVLSACESGLGTGTTSDIPAGEDFVSFPRAFMTAGAGSVVASLWLVEDASTARFMEGFYRSLQYSTSNPGNGPSAGVLVSALTQAQRDRIAEIRNHQKEPHPFSWGAFFLTGDGR